MEKNIIKIAVKAYLLVDNGTLTADDFLVADKPLREAFELMVKVYKCVLDPFPQFLDC